MWKCFIASYGAVDDDVAAVQAVLARRIERRHVEPVWFDELKDASRLREIGRFGGALLLVVGEDARDRAELTDVLQAARQAGVKPCLAWLDDARRIVGDENAVADCDRLGSCRGWTVPTRPRKGLEQALGPLVDSLRRRQWRAEHRLHLALACLVVVASLAMRYPPSWPSGWRAVDERSAAGIFLDAGATLQMFDSKRQVTRRIDLPPVATSIRRIDFSNTELDDQRLGALPIRFGVELDLRATAISDAGVTALEKFRQLQRLDLRKTRLTPAAIRGLKAAIPACEILYDANASAARWAMETGLVRHMQLEVQMNPSGTRGRFDCTNVKDIPADKPVWILELALSRSKNAEGEDASEETLISGSELSRLAGLEELTTLTLDLPDLPIADVCRTAPLPKLQRLILPRRNLSNAETTELNKAFPNVVIEAS